jgi:hypothetical protein
MNYKEISALINIKESIISSRCNTTAGCYMAWICREILCCRYYQLTKFEKQVLIEILQIICDTRSKTNVGKKFIYTFERGLLVFPTINLRNYEKVHATKGNPFNYNVNFKLDANSSR